MAKGCALSTGDLPRGGLPRNSVDRITDRPDMTSAVDRGRKASIQTNKQNRSIDLHKCTEKKKLFCSVHVFPKVQNPFSHSYFWEKKKICHRNFSKIFIDGTKYPCNIEVLLYFYLIINDQGTYISLPYYTSY